MMTRLQALASGAAGACAVTLLNEVTRRLLPHAPRMEVIGMRALAKSMRKVDQAPPSGDRLYWPTLIGDLVSNSVYYSFAAADDARRTWRRGLLLGLAAGLGAVLLPEPLGLGRQPGQRFPLTHALTVGWYLAGGLAAAATSNLLHARSGRR